MHTALFASRLLLAGVFALASVTKLSDLAGSRAAVAGFGVNERLAAPLGTLLPFAELGIAVALLPAASARFGALAAAALLALFVIAIVRSIARGEAPDCHCFGQLHSEPAGPRTLARNAVLLGLATFVAVGGWHGSGPSATAWIGHISSAGAVALGAGLAIAALAALTGWALLALLRQNGRLLLRIDALEARLDARGMPVVPEPHDGLPLGDPAPPFALEGLYGETVTLASLTAADRPVLVVFTDPSCGPCNALMPRISDWQRRHAELLTVAVLTRGSKEDNRAKAREHGVAGVLLDPELDVYTAYRAVGTPGAVLIDAEGRVGSAFVGGADAIARLVDEAVRGPALEVVQAQSVGAEVPKLDLVNLDGARISLVEPDRDTLVLFWNPGCGFCQRMLGDVRAFEQSARPEAPRLLLISTGSVEENEAMGLASEIALDPEFAAGRAFGGTGTPSGILVGRDGTVASGLAVGAPAVMALATNGREGPRPPGRPQEQ